MARRTTQTDQNTTPEEFPQVAPPNLYATSDIRFVMLEIGKLTTKVDRLIDDVAGQGEKLDALRHQVSFVKGAMWVIGGVLAILSVASAWYFSGKLSVTVGPAAAVSTQTPAPVAKTAPVAAAPK